MDLGCTPRELPLLVHASEVESGLRDRIAEMESIAMAAEEAMRHAEHPLEVPSYMLPTVSSAGKAANRHGAESGAALEPEGMPSSVSPGHGRQAVHELHAMHRHENGMLQEQLDQARVEADTMERSLRDLRFDSLSQQRELRIKLAESRLGIAAVVDKAQRKEQSWRGKMGEMAGHERSLQKVSGKALQQGGGP